MINSLLQKLESATHPVAQILHQNAHFKVLILAFKAGMLLKDHTAKEPTKLTVMEGSVEYRENEKTILLEKYATIDIPVSITHAVYAKTDAICLLTQG
ncbi:MAG: hypothetical protein ACK4IY_01355 [Chitinophagales bacterium]